MKYLTKILSVATFLGLVTGPVLADPIDLFDYGFNVDGSTTEGSLGDPTPGNVDVSGFDFLTGLGTITMTVSGAGAHNTLLFVDHEIDESLNTFFNELASSGGSLAAGQTAETDEPGFVSGDIYDNFLDNTLDNSHGAGPDDVSMAMGWDFVLAAGEEAVASFFLSETNDAPGTALWLAHSDTESPNVIYFWSTLQINAVGVPVPEPGTLALFGLGLVGFGFARKRKA